MEYRTLGRTGLRVSAVALGCEGFMHKRAEEVKADFDFAIGHGINFVDIYSSNPDLRADIGAALEGRRGEFIIQGHLCTVWENDQYLRTRDPQKSADSFERQLRQLDIADFLLMEDTPPMILARMIQRNPALQTFIDTFGLELVDAEKTE